MADKFQNKYRIESHRLKGWDYSGNGYYFITICIQNMRCLLGSIENGKMKLNEWGQIAHTEWIKSFQIRTELYCHTFIIMPNHLHAIIEINKNNCTDVQPHGSAAPNASLHPNILNTSPIVPHGSVALHPNIINTPQNSQPNSNAALAPDSFIRKPKSISSFMAGYKSAVTKGINNHIDQNPGNPLFPKLGKFSRNNKLWQANYHDHIIRNDKSYQRIKTYIHENPLKWDNDK